MRFEYRRMLRKFCSQRLPLCGKDGVITRDCHPLTENAMRIGARPPVTYYSRPHVTVRGQIFEALLDIGSEISFVNQDTAKILQELSEPLITEKDEIDLGQREHDPDSRVHAT